MPVAALSPFVVLFFPRDGARWPGVQVRCVPRSIDTSPKQSGLCVVQSGAVSRSSAPGSRRGPLPPILVAQLGLDRDAGADFAEIGLLVRHEPQLRPVLLGLEDRRLHFPGRSSKLSASSSASWNSRRCSAGISTSGGSRRLLDPAVQVGARHWQSVRRGGYYAPDVAPERRALPPHRRGLQR